MLWPQSPMPEAEHMEITELPTEGYERVVKAHDPESGLRAIISVYDTTLGPAVGGLRMWPYESEEDALFDVLRLSKGMAYKSAVAHTGMGGGKAVIIGDPAAIKSDELYLAMGRFIDSLDGLYYTAEDVNTRVRDLEVIRRVTPYVTGLARESGGSGNPSPYTAYGVYLGIRAALGWRFGSDDPKGRSVVIQGVGAVGSEICYRLRDAGAHVFVADPKTEKVAAAVDQWGAEEIVEEDVLVADVDVLAPCALGAIIDDDTLPGLRCKIIAGATNNPLLDARHGEELRDRGILYAPDYVINSGGIINVACEFEDGGYDESHAIRRIERIPQALRELWTIAKAEGIPPSRAADRLAEKILAEASVTPESPNPV
ncbi:MAG: Glu/Leu/Phe/Val dehydrogenase dimerization domain-containing protein [Planctomycetota bacterium]|nr:Glu/Leu/Phe/Val dehydrogenase dimerization domain-containing protein [Planctomycetota bacterium]